jgi:mono/diheme cytochrome c family protein
MAERWRAAVLALTIFATASGPSAGIAADAANGERLARRWCASCHVVAPDQPMVTTEAPPFSEIARRPGFSPRSIAFFLLDPHPKMPDMGLSRRAAEDLAAFIDQQR